MAILENLTYVAKKNSLQYVSLIANFVVMSVFMYSAYMCKIRGEGGVRWAGRGRKEGEGKGGEGSGRGKDDNDRGCLSKWGYILHCTLYIICTMLIPQSSFSSQIPYLYFFQHQICRCLKKLYK
jgi:hypothetical protein